MNRKDIKTFIPQREPVIMVDELMEVAGDTAVTRLTVRSDNYFLDGDGVLTEAGMLEHIAQSASAVAGYRAIAAGAAVPPVGYIGEVKRFNCYSLPRIGDELRTTVTIGAEVAGVTVITGETRVSGTVMTNTQMKIFIWNNN